MYCCTIDKDTGASVCMVVHSRPTGVGQLPLTAKVNSCRMRKSDGHNLDETLRFVKIEQYDIYSLQHVRDLTPRAPRGWGGGVSGGGGVFTTNNRGGTIPNPPNPPPHELTDVTGHARLHLHPGLTKNAERSRINPLCPSSW